MLTTHAVLLFQQVRSKISDVKCGTCRHSLLQALGKGLGRGGFPLTKLVKLAACSAGDDDNLDEANGNGHNNNGHICNGRNGNGHHANGNSGSACSMCMEEASKPLTPGDMEFRAPVVLTNGGGGGGGRFSRIPDRLRIRAPVTPDLLRQVIGVVQSALTPPAAAPGAAAAAGRGGSPPSKKRGAPPQASLHSSARLSAKDWLTTYPAPTTASRAGGGASSASALASNGLSSVRGTGTGSLAIPRVRYASDDGGGGGLGERNLWTLMERVEWAKDNAFKCCGVIEASTGGSVQSGDSVASNGSGSAGGGALVTGSGSAGGGGGSAAAASSNVQWNPQFAPRLHEAEAALVDWLTELTMALHGLTFPFSLTFVSEDASDSNDGVSGGGSEGGGGGGGSDLAEATSLADNLWAEYEDSVKRQLELTLEARREQLREQSQPMGIALCFAAENRLSASELLERKRTEMTALHEATIGVMAAPRVEPLLARAEKARQRWSGMLVGEDIRALDELVERVLKARLQVRGRGRAGRRGNGGSGGGCVALILE